MATIASGFGRSPRSFTQFVYTRGSYLMQFQIFGPCVGAQMLMFRANHVFECAMSF